MTRTIQRARVILGVLYALNSGVRRNITMANTRDGRRLSCGLLRILVVCIVGACGQQALSPPSSVQAEQLCALARLAKEIPADLRAAIAAARRGDSEASLAASTRARDAGVNLGAGLSNVGGLIPPAIGTALITAR